MQTLTKDEALLAIAERFDKNESEIIELHEKMGKFFKFYQLMQESGEKMNNLITRLQNINSTLDMHNNAISQIEQILNDFKENGVGEKTTKQDINYDVLVKKLVKATQDIIINEIQFALKNK